MLILRSIVMAYSTCSTEYRFSRALLLGLLPLLSTLLLLPLTGAEGTSNCNSKGWDPNAKGARCNSEGWDPNSKGAQVGGEPCPCLLVDPQMHPTTEVYYGQDVAWQIPPHPKAILYIAPGASQSPFDFFDRGPTCQRCIGYPENRALTLEALKRGFAVIVVQSIGDSFISWPLEESEDLVIVVNVIQEWTRKHSLESLPLSTLGNSAGSSFVTSLTMSSLPIRAQVLMCGPGQHQVEENIEMGGQFPPTFFAYMPKDNVTLTSSKTIVERAISVLQKRGVEVATKHLWPKPLSPLFFTERIPCMSNATSEKIFMAYKAEEWVGRNGYLMKNPHMEDWEAVLLKLNLPFYPDSGDCHLSAFLDQELKMAFAVHSFTSDANEEIFSWLESVLLLRDHSLTHTLPVFE